MKRIARLVWNICIYALALIGLFFVFRWALANYDDGSGTVRVIEDPSHAYKAVVKAYAGGGGLAPYCYIKVLVAPASDVASEKHEVYVGECESTEVEWVSPLLLRISDTSESTMPRTLRHKDVSGKVRVQYEFR